MAKTYDQYMAESGQQSTLDQLRGSGQYDAAKAQWEAGNSGGITPTGTSTPGSTYSSTGIKPTKTFDQFLAESGRQTELDQLRATPFAYEQAKAKYESGSYGAVSSPGGVSGMSGLLTTQPTINLPQIYQNLYGSSGITDIEKQLSDKEKSFNEAQSKINDNPFLSEATRVGRIQKLTTDYQNSIASLQKDVATKKADIETQMNLQTKQFDINSQQATQALSQFNTLLSAGALDNASGEDIANITRATGISSAMIQSAVNASKAKNVQYSTISYDDGTNQGFAIINAQTGEIIKKQVVAASKPEKATGGITPTQSREITAQASKALSTVDEEGGNKDYYLSLEEYKKAVQLLVEATGVDTTTASQTLTAQMDALGYHKWRW